MNIKRWSALYNGAFLLSYVVFNLEWKGKVWSDQRLRLHLYNAVKLWNDLFKNKKPQTNSLGIHLTRALNTSKHFEKVMLLVQGDADPCVLDWQEDVFEPEFDTYRDFPVWSCELKSIWKKVHKNLLHPLFIWNHKVLLAKWTLPSYRRLELAKVDLNMNLFLVGLVTLDIYDFVNCFSDIEFSFIFTELTRLHLSHSEHIFYMKKKNLGGVMLNFIRIIDLIKNFSLLVCDSN